MANNEQYGSDDSLDQLSMEQLEDFLRADLTAPGRENEHTVFHILELMEQREKEAPSGRLPDVDQAWSEFQTYYNIPEGEDMSLYPVRTPSEPPAQVPPTKPHRAFRPRKLLIAVAVLILLFGSLLTAQAAGVPIFGAIGHWTEEQFRFSLNGLSGETDDQLQEESQKMGFPAGLAPTWHPKGFVPQTPTSNHIEKFIDTTYCQYVNEEKNLFYLVDITYYYDTAALEATIFEKDDSEVLTYESHGRTFYIFSNLDTMTSTWSDGHFNVMIAGDLDVKEIQKIIDSMGD